MTEEMTQCKVKGTPTKSAKWQKGIVEWTEGNTAFISVVFSWHANAAYSRAIYYRQLGYDVKVGGPGVFVLGRMLKGVAQVGGSIPDTVYAP